MRRMERICPFTSLVRGVLSKPAPLRSGTMVARGSLSKTTPVFLILNGMCGFFSNCSYRTVYQDRCCVYVRV